MNNNQELQTWEEFKSLIGTYSYSPARTQVNVACPGWEQHGIKI